MECDLTRVLLAAYIDDELDRGAMAAVASHLEGCRACTALQKQGLAAKQLVREHATRFDAPADLVASLTGAANAPLRATPAWSRRAWLATLAASAGAAALSAVVTWHLARPDAAAPPESELLAAHLRALRTGHLYDVASSDRHTVKPWFAGKLGFSPPVTDLAGDGFTLAGGRVERVAGQEAAALVYRRRAHVIDLYVWPEDGPDVAPRTQALRGFSIVAWVAGGMRHTAISDLNATELAQFAALVGARA